MTDDKNRLEPMTDEQRDRWNQTKLFPVERWSTGPDSTPLVCQIPTNDELRLLALAVPAHIQCSGWYVGKPSFGNVYVYGDDFRGTGRQALFNFPAGRKYFGGLGEYIAAVHPRTVLRLLDRITELENCCGMK